MSRVDMPPTNAPRGRTLLDEYERTKPILGRRTRNYRRTVITYNVELECIRWRGRPIFDRRKERLDFNARVRVFFFFFVAFSLCSTLTPLLRSLFRMSSPRPLPNVMVDHPFGRVSFYFHFVIVRVSPFAYVYVHDLWF